MLVLGISAFYHDSAAVLLRDGKIVAAAQEERFSRRRHDARYPERAIAYCLEQAGARLEEVDSVAFYDKPFLKFERILETYLSFAPRGFGSFRLVMPTWLREKLFLKPLLIRRLSALAPGVEWRNRLVFSEHHLSHAASAFYPSPFEDALVLTLDGVGEWATSSVAMGSGARLEIERELHFPHSLGLLYSAFTGYTGFRVNSGEYKVMGLAPYGEPRYAKLILQELLDVKEDGSFRLNLEYFDYCTGLRMTNARFDALFGGCARRPEEKLEQRHMDLAASVQAVTEEVMLRLTRALSRETGARNLCLAGGVALNCVANGKVLRDGRFSGLWIQPAAGDAGGALGAAYVAHCIHRGQARDRAPRGDAMQGSYLGPEYAQEEIEQRLTALGARFEVLTERELIAQSARAIEQGAGLGWFQGRMEFGPRALGARSILADPRSPRMQSQLNLKIKHRESFRPFAPSVLAESVSEWFELEGESPYMLLVADVAVKRRVPGSEIPAVTHVDHSARVQTVHMDTNPLYHALLAEFDRLTGCPVLVNTSFNVRGEPIVCTPEDAYHCFMGTGLDALAIGRCFLLKSEQPEELCQEYHSGLELD
jgi:carbamoyltransferase